MALKILKTIIAGLVLGVSLSYQPSITFNELWGEWELIGVIYNDQEIEPINPGLITRFEFKEPRTLYYRYHEEGDEGFCERAAVFEIGRLKDDGPQILYQRVVWANANNKPECREDLNMQLGTESWSPIERVDQEIRLTLPLGEEEVMYRLKKQTQK